MPQGVRVTTFISHNKEEKNQARSLAVALAEQGESVWFDEWNVRPGESLTGGIEQGLDQSDTFVILWSESAAQSNWVGTEIRAYLRRRVDDSSLRIVPIMVDETKLPTLVADYRGFSLNDSTTVLEIASQICGITSEAELVRRLNKRLHDLTYDSEASNDPLPYIRCPECGHKKLERKMTTAPQRDDNFYFIDCKSCG